jgi:hypothetical protein
MLLGSKLGLREQKIGYCVAGAITVSQKEFKTLFFKVF